MALAVAFIGESRDTTAGRRLDIPGLTASAVALFSLTYALIEGHDKGWTSAGILGAFALAALAGGALPAHRGPVAGPDGGRSPCSAPGPSAAAPAR